MSHKDGRVILSAWVEPVLRDYARTAARSAGMEFSKWVALAIQRAVAEESCQRAIRLATIRGECASCGHAPCLCDQQ